MTKQRIVFSSNKTTRGIVHPLLIWCVLIIILLALAPLLGEAQKKQTPKKDTVKAKAVRMPSADSIPAMDYARISLAATMICGKFALDSISNLYNEKMFTIELSGCIAQEMYFGKAYNGERCQQKLLEMKKTLNVIAIKYEEQLKQQLQNMNYLVRRKWKQIILRAQEIQLDEKGTNYVLYEM